VGERLRIFSRIVGQQEWHVIEVNEGESKDMILTEFAGLRELRLEVRVEVIRD
jgi:hypothetical protein